MRVTSEMQTQQTLRNLQMHYARMSKLQDQLASGKRIQRPSDAPADMVQILQNRAEDLRLDTHLSTIRDAGVVLQTSVDAMIELALGGLPPMNRGKLLFSRLRYFDPDKRRAGMPEPVAAT